MPGAALGDPAMLQFDEQCPLLGASPATVASALVERSPVVFYNNCKSLK